MASSSPSLLGPCKETEGTTAAAPPSPEAAAAAIKGQESSLWHRPSRVAPVKGPRGGSCGSALLFGSGSRSCRGEAAAPSAAAVLPPRARSMPTPTRDSVTLNKLRFGSLDMYGRRSEAGTLREVLQRFRGEEEQMAEPSPVVVGDDDDAATATTSDDVMYSRSEVVLISGRSGTGKTRLANSIRALVRRINNGCFIGGKFDLQRRMEPYTAFISAFQQLMDCVLSAQGKDSQVFRDIKASIQAELGSDAAVLAGVIPNIELLVGSSVGAVGLGPVELTNRFNMTLCRFFRALCRSSILVLFLDDVQWADEASLRLIEAIMADSENSGMLLICTHRDDEDLGNDSQPLTRALASINEKLLNRGKRLRMAHLQLGSLEVDTVSEMLADLLSCSTEKTARLAAVVHKKTLGNVLAVIEYVSSLCAAGLLRYCFGTLQWRWDPDEIESNTTLTGNVVDLMTRKLRENLTMDCREVLIVASCLGSEFDRPMMRLAKDSLRSSGVTLRMDSPDSVSPDNAEGGEGAEGPDIDLEDLLEFCVKEGLLDKSSKDVSYRFSHDAIQHAAFSLIPRQERDVLQFHIGEGLVDGLSPDELERTLFTAVDLSNHGVGFIAGRKRILLAELNLRAAVKAKETSAFSSGAAYAKTGITLLGDSLFHADHNALSLDLVSTAAEIAYCNSDLEVVKKYTGIVFAQQDLPFDDKFRAYSTLIYSLGKKNRTLEALEIYAAIACELGVSLPHPMRVSTPRVLMELKKTMRLVRRCKNLRDLPVMNDKSKERAIEIFFKIGSSAYCAAPTFFFLIILKTVRWSIRYGMCWCSHPFFAAYGGLLCGVFGELEQGNEFGEIAMTANDEMKSYATGIVHFSVAHWVKPFCLGMKPLLEGYEMGMKTGDLEGAMLCSFDHCQYLFFSGRPLRFVETEFRKYIGQMYNLQVGKIWSMAEVYWQLVLNLMGRSEEAAVLTGEVFNFDKRLAEVAMDGNHDPGLVYHAKTVQSWLCFYFGQYSRAWDLVMETVRDRETYNSPFTTVRWECFRCLISLAVARRGKRVKSWKYRAAMSMKKVKRLVARGNVNCIHMAHLFEAEFAAIKGKEEKAREKYDLAITTAAKHGFLHDRALACELAGDFFIGSSDEYWAEHYLKMAHQLYACWGSEAKCNHLKRKHPAVDFTESKSVEPKCTD